MGPELPDLIAGLVSLIALIGFVQFWKPKYRPEYAAALITTKSPFEDEESVDSSRASHRDTNSIKQPSAGDPHTTEGKYETTQTENIVENQEHPSQQEGDHKETYKNQVPAEEDGPKALAVKKPNTRETLLAWSPWVIIVVVVIM